jgi:hypothetical protein
MRPLRNIGWACRAGKILVLSDNFQPEMYYNTLTKSITSLKFDTICLCPLRRRHNKAAQRL